MNNISFQAVHFKASDQLEDFVKDKVSKLFDQDDSILRADVTLFEGASGNPRNQFCEIQLSVSGENHFVKKNTESYEKSVLSAVVALQKIIRRKKTKGISRRRKT
ncbi:MAG: HPF/RaiA family ribosome-associated protein [Bacteroidales bacterium]|nr:HPF/RaiA family ribosome-associated protein [Bacteroidales bacterium]